MMYECSKHHGEKLTYICTEKHDCNIKICNRSNSLLIPLIDFQHQAIDGFRKNINEYKNTQISQYKQNLKKLLNDIQTQFQKAIKDIDELAINLFKTIDSKEKEFFELSKHIETRNIAEFTKQELQLIIQFTSNQEFSNILKERKQIGEILQNINANTNSIFNKFLVEIKQLQQLQIKKKEEPQKLKIKIEDVSTTTKINKYLQEIINLINQYQGIKYYFTNTDDPKHLLINHIKMKLMKKLYEANEFHIQLEQQFATIQSQKNIINEMKNQAGQIFNKYIAQLQPGIRTDLSFQFEYYSKSLELTEQYQNFKFLLDEIDLYFISISKIENNSLVYDKLMKNAQTFLEKTQEMLKQNFSQHRLQHRFQSDCIQRQSREVHFLSERKIQRSSSRK